MTYEEILKELEEVNLKDKFTSVFEDRISSELLKMIQKTDKIHSTGAMVRSLMKHFENESDEWLYWQKVFLYFITPVFKRELNF